MKKEKTILKVGKRDVLGKKLRKMRKHGQMPANVYGANFKSTSITAQLKDFLKVYRTAKETGVVYLQLDGKDIPTLITHIQKHPVSGLYLHVDFRAIDLKQKVEASVPIVTVNQSTAVSQKGGVLLTTVDHLMVEALPEEIPQHIEIDLARLIEIGAELKVKDLATSTSYVVKEDPEKLILSVIAHKEESVTPETETAAPEVLTEKKEEGEEAGQQSEGTVPAQEPASTKEKSKKEE